MAGSQAPPGVPRRRRGRLARAVRRSVSLVRRRLLPSDAFVLIALSLAAIALGWAFMNSPRLVPSSMLALVILAGGFLLRLRSLLMLYVVVGSVLAYELFAPGG